MTPLAKKLKAFCERFRGHRRFGIPEYIAHQRNEGVELEPKHQETEGHGHGPSERAKFAAKVKFSKLLKLHSTDAQLRAYSFTIADKYIASRRKHEKRKAKAA